MKKYIGIDRFSIVGEEDVIEIEVAEDDIPPQPGDTISLDGEKVIVRKSNRMHPLNQNRIAIVLEEPWTQNKIPLTT